MKRWLEPRRGSPRAEAHSSSSRRNASRDRGPGPGEVRGVLECACKDATSAVVLVQDSGEVLRGRFARLEGSRVTLALDPIRPGLALRPLSLCCVSFAHDERAYVFLSPLWGTRKDRYAPGRFLLSVGIPGQIASLDTGSARRIPIGVGVTLSIEVGTYDRRAWTPDAVDLSTTGVLLDFGDEIPPRLPVGALVEIALEFEGVRAELTAAVRRREENRLALSFVDAGAVAADAIPDALQSLLSSLEQRWLESSHG